MGKCISRMRHKDPVNAVNSEGNNTNAPVDNLRVSVSPSNQAASGSTNNVSPQVQGASHFHLIFIYSCL